MEKLSVFLLRFKRFFFTCCQCRSNWERQECFVSGHDKIISWFNYPQQITWRNLWPIPETRSNRQVHELIFQSTKTWSSGQIKQNKNHWNRPHHIIITCSLHQRYCNIVWVPPKSRETCIYLVRGLGFPWVHSHRVSLGRVRMSSGPQHYLNVHCPCELSITLMIMYCVLDEVNC